MIYSIHDIRWDNLLCEINLQVLDKCMTLRLLMLNIKSSHGKFKCNKKKTTYHHLSKANHNQPVIENLG